MAVLDVHVPVGVFTEKLAALVFEEVVDFFVVVFLVVVFFVDVLLVVAAFVEAAWTRIIR
ncbi:hypothetical protein N624_0523 [Levilactobacillus brevis]|nr:hypothetical protein N624_0523 [Levilactobacillus brevis]